MDKGQTRIHSGFEAIANVVVGFGVAFVSNIYVLPLFGFNVTATDALGIGMIYTVISIVRSYCLRRFFNLIMVKGGKR